MPTILKNRFIDFRNFLSSLQVAIRAVAARHGIDGGAIPRLGSETGDRVVELAHHITLLKLEALGEGLLLRRGRRTTTGAAHRSVRRGRRTASGAAHLSRVVRRSRRHLAAIIFTRSGISHRGTQRIVEHTLHLTEHTTLLVVKFIGEFLEAIRDLFAIQIVMIHVGIHASTTLHSTLLIVKVLLLKRISGTHGNRGTHQNLAKHLVSERGTLTLIYLKPRRRINLVEEGSEEPRKRRRTKPRKRL